MSSRTVTVLFCCDSLHFLNSLLNGNSYLGVIFRVVILYEGNGDVRSLNKSRKCNQFEFVVKTLRSIIPNYRNAFLVCIK